MSENLPSDLRFCQAVDLPKKDTAEPVEGGSATLNVTTSSEEPVEIQSSNDLKVWKRIQSLENANGRSVTLPVGSDKEFLRAVEP